MTEKLLPLSSDDISMPNDPRDREAMTQIEGRLRLVGIASQPMKVFRASGIDQLVEIKEAVV